MNQKKFSGCIAKKFFDLILLAIMMPKMNGFEVCKIIREDERYRDVPIIFLTAYSDLDSLVPHVGRCK